MKLTTSLFFLLSALVLPRQSAAQDAAGDILLNSAARELERAFAKLKDAERAPLYFLSYEISDISSYELSASMGDLASEARDRKRVLDVDARVGSMQLDNTHQLKGERQQQDRQADLPRYVLPVQDEENAIRAQIWLATDKEYKSSLKKYMKVEMNKAVTTEEENPAPDFSAVAPESYYEDPKVPEFDAQSWKERLRRLSAQCRKYPFVHGCSVELSLIRQARIFVSSEGSRIRTVQDYARLGYNVSSRADDGMELYRSRYYDAAAPGALPSAEQVSADLEQSFSELDALRKAPLVQPFSGPVILKSRAAAVFFHEIFGHRVEGHRQKLEREGQTFAKMLGKQVCSEIINVYDDPTLESRGGRFLRGYYKFDDEGVKARRVQLVEKGELKGFLMSRSPIKDFESSNGHGRRSPGRPVVARQGNLVVESRNPVPYDKLRGMLVQECKRQGKPYGLVFDDISGGFTMTDRALPQSFKVLPLLVYRVYADGRPDELVRGVDIVGTPLSSFMKITAAADDEDIFNGTCGAESGWVPVSAIAPSLLISDMEVEKTKKTHQRPPLLPSPFHEPGGAK